MKLLIVEPETETENQSEVTEQYEPIQVPVDLTKYQCKNSVCVRFPQDLNFAQGQVYATFRATIQEPFQTYEWPLSECDSFPLTSDEAVEDPQSLFDQGLIDYVDYRQRKTLFDEHQHLKNWQSTPSKTFCLRPECKDCPI